MIDSISHDNFRGLGFLMGSIKSGSYLGIFLLSVLVSFVVPLPEVVALLLFGFIGATTELNIFFVFLIAFIGSVLGNNILYRLSFLGNSWTEKFNVKMRKHKLIKYEHLVADNIFKTIYFLRLVTGVRFFGPVIAGSLGSPWKKFFLADFGATFLNTAFFVFLGYQFHRHIFSLIAEVEIFRNILLFSSVVIVSFLLNVFSKDRK